MTSCHTDLRYSRSKRRSLRSSMIKMPKIPFDSFPCTLQYPQYFISTFPTSFTLHGRILKFSSHAPGRKGRPYVRLSDKGHAAYCGTESHTLDGDRCFPFMGCVQLRMEYTWADTRLGMRGYTRTQIALAHLTRGPRTFPRRCAPRDHAARVSLLPNVSKRPLILYLLLLRRTFASFPVSWEFCKKKRTKFGEVSENDLK